MSSKSGNPAVKEPQTAAAGAPAQNRAVEEITVRNARTKKDLVRALVREYRQKKDEEIKKEKEKLRNLKKALHMLEKVETKTKKEKEEAARKAKEQGLIEYLKDFDRETIERKIKWAEMVIQRLRDDKKDAKINVLRSRFRDVFFDERKEIRCTSRDEEILYPTLEKDFIRIYNFGDAGDGGYSSRYTKTWFEIIDEGKINRRPAWLFEVGIATYYNNHIRGTKKKRYLAGYDDGHLFLTQVYTTSATVEEALDRIIPSEVKKAKKEGKKVLRQGDLWFIETKKKIPLEAFKETEIRPGHHGLYADGYATGKIVHDEHGVLDLGDRIWKVARNRTVSRSRAYYD